MNTFKIIVEDIAEINNDTAIYLNALFASGTKDFGQLAYELQREFRFGGSPDVRRINIDRVTFDAEKSTGQFRVVLDIDFTFGCEDVLTQKYGQTSEWTFTVDRNKQTLQFSSSPYAESRSTADEF